jgi:hypothetical protein
MKKQRVGAMAQIRSRKFLLTFLQYAGQLEVAERCIIFQMQGKFGRQSDVGLYGN